MTRYLLLNLLVGCGSVTLNEDPLPVATVTLGPSKLSNLTVSVF